VGRQFKFLMIFLYAIVRYILKVRYNVTVKYLTPIQTSKPILFLPNHPAEIDPILLMVNLGPKYFPRPMVVEHFYRLKGFQWILDLIGVIPIPTMEEKANIWRGKEITKVLSDVITKIKNGESFLIYPAGKLKGTGREQIGGASFVHNLLQVCPDIHVVLVRTTGLWGSSFSKAPTGKSPEFAKTLFKNCWNLLKSGVFFLPKRNVLIEIAQAPDSLPISSPRVVFNKFLEEWYNQHPDPGPEPLNLVSYSPWKEEFLTMSHAISSGCLIQNVTQVNVPLDVENQIKQEIATLAKVDIATIHRTTNLSNDLGLDSLDLANLHIFLDRKFDVVDYTPGELLTLEDILLVVTGAFHKKDQKHSKETSPIMKFKWPKEPFRKAVKAPMGKTIPEAFLKICDYMPNASAVGDANAGILTYRKLKTASLVMAKKIALLEGEKIGIMTPASVGSYITVLACLLANKIPVMLNWTNGMRGLDYASDTIKMNYVLTSRLFLDKANLRTLGKIEPKLVYLEDIRHSINTLDKIKGLFSSYKKAEKLLHELDLELKSAYDPAVVLFTSGTESLPKVVPLSHENLLFNQRSSLSCVKLKRSDSLYCVLPPFHSFGFSITGLMPILCGIKAFYAPDPNNSRGMVSDIKATKSTMIFCAPSFIRSLFAVADPADLQSLRLIVSGAEKATNLEDYIKLNLPSTSFIEGYGITECSPVVTMTRIGESVAGVGKPLPGVKIAIVNPVTKERQNDSQEGEICINSPSVFSGYLNPGSQSPFIEMDGLRWYLSGDMGFIDNSGNLILTGRLKRFVKVGGEMISLGGLEEEILQFASSRGLISKNPSAKSLALCVKEKHADRPELVLFSTIPMLREEINAHLKDAGWGRIIKIAEVKELDEIPLTSVGKTDYRLLDEKYLAG